MDAGGSIPFAGFPIRVASFGGGGTVNAADNLIHPPFPLDSRGWRENRRGDNADAWQSAMHLYFAACSSCRSAAAAAPGYSCLLPILRVHRGGSGVPRAQHAGVTLAVPSSLPGEPPGLQTREGFSASGSFPAAQTSAGWEHSSCQLQFIARRFRLQPFASCLRSSVQAGQPHPLHPACSSRPSLPLAPPGAKRLFQAWTSCSQGQRLNRSRQRLCPCQAGGDAAGPLARCIRTPKELGLTFRTLWGAAGAWFRQGFGCDGLAVGTRGWLAVKIGSLCG